MARERREGGMGLRGGDVGAALARVAAVWGRRGSCVEAVLGQCESDARAAPEVRVEGCTSLYTWFCTCLGFELVFRAC